jgi:hypothetical protein
MDRHRQGTKHSSWAATALGVLLVGVIVPANVWGAPRVVLTEEFTSLG